MLNTNTKCISPAFDIILLYALNANHVQFKSENLQITNIRKSAVLVYLVINSSKHFYQIRKGKSSRDLQRSITIYSKIYIDIYACMTIDCHNSI